MQMTDAERQAYDAKIMDIVQIITADGDESRQLFSSETILAREMLPEEPINQRVLTAVKGAHLVFSVTELKKAMHNHFRSVARAAKCQDRLGIGEPANEREYITAFMAVRGYDMDYHRQFLGPDNKPKKLEDIINDARLTAGDLDLTKPRGTTLSVTEIGFALAEWANRRREQRKRIAADAVRQLPPGRDRQAIDAAFKQVCQWYFAEPEYAEAACRKFIWAVKRRLLGMPIKHVHMLCLIGKQDTGKTEMCKMLYAPLGELAIEASLPDLLDTRQLDMPEYSVAFCDELAFAEHARPAQLKTFLNGGTPSRRPMRSNISERIAVNVTVLATANHSLDKLIYDSSGMRRFVEVKPKERSEVEPFWDEIVEFDWMALWQSIDPAAADPLVSRFRTELMRRQETIRNLDNTELWLRNFDVEEVMDYRRRETSTAEKIEFYAAEIYEHGFRRWEETFDPGYRTSLQRFGREMRSLIDNGVIEGWYHRIAANKTVYGHNVAHKPSNQVVVAIPTRRTK